MPSLYGAKSARGILVDDDEARVRTAADGLEVRNLGDDADLWAALRAWEACEPATAEERAAWAALQTVAQRCWERGAKDA